MRARMRLAQGAWAEREAGCGEASGRRGRGMLLAYGQKRIGRKYF